MKTQKSPAMEILEKYKEIIWPVLKDHLESPSFPKIFAVPREFNYFSDYHWNLCRDYPLRKGKYLRPTVLSLCSLAMGGNLQETLPTACSMQISEDWILIHDDIEDDSYQRRGDLTLHKKYNVGMAVNAGDTLHATTWKVLAHNFDIFPLNKAKKIHDEFYKILTRTTMGQTAEMKLIKDNKLDVSEDLVLFIIDGKTSYYSVAGPLRLGALVADANINQINILTEFGLNLGRCFQLTDDVLDLTSDFGGLKNQKGNDILEGKRTLIYSHLYKSCKGDDLKKLERIYSKKREEKSADEVEWVIFKMKKYKSIAYAQNMAFKFKMRAEKILDNDMDFLKKEPYIKELRILMEFVLNRKT
jgi:geranylgeranyl diphosphate synthase, type II